MARIAIIGAGLSGLTCARSLEEAGHQAVVFEKSRGPGGRMSTRRQEGYRFDHGAQYFTVKSEAFEEAVDSWLEAGVAAPWNGKVVAIEGNNYREKVSRRWVGTPGMSSICKELSDGLELHTETRVAPLEAGLDLIDVDGIPLGDFDALVCSAPADQTRELLARASPEIAEKAGEGRFAPCWSVMLGGVSNLRLTFDAAAVPDSAVAWFARDASKPARESNQTWVLHASVPWSMENLELEPDEVIDALFDSWTDIVGDVDPKFATAHRWRYAQVMDPVGEDCLVDEDARIVACGDWCIAPRVEAAFQSGRAASEAVLKMV